MPRPIPINRFALKEKGFELETTTEPIWKPDKESEKTFKDLISLMQAKGEFITSPDNLINELNELKAQDVFREKGEIKDKKEIEIKYDTLYTMIDLSLSDLEEKKQTDSEEYSLLKKAKELIRKAITERLNLTWLETPTF